MPNIGLSIFPWLVLMLGLGGGFGPPLGVPPLPEDAVLAKIAPDACLAYMSAAGMATPDPKSTNQTEQLLAEPEVRQMAGEIERAIRATGRGHLPPGLASDDLVDLAKLLLTRPVAVYVSSVQMQPGGPMIRGGVMVNLGDDAEKIKAKVDSITKVLLAQVVQSVEIEGQTYQTMKAAPNCPVTWGFREKYFLLGVGDGEIQAMLQRTKGPQPKWLTQVHEQFPVERLSTVTYFNLKAIFDAAAPMAGPNAAILLPTLGLSNVTTLVSVGSMDQNGCVSKTLIRIDGEPGGVFSLANVKPLTLADLTPIPRDAAIALAVKFDPEAAFRLVQEVVGKTDPQVRHEMDRNLHQMTDETGVNLEDDIIKSLGDTWCLFSSPAEGGALNGLTVVASLRDPQRVALANTKLVKLLRAEIERVPVSPNGPFFGPPRLEEIDFAGRKIYVIQGGPAMWLGAPAWCLTDKELIVGLLPQNIKGYLSRRAGFKSLAEVPTVADAFRGESGPQKILYSDSRQLFDVLYPMILTYARFGGSMLRQRGVDVNLAMLPSSEAIRPHLGSSLTTVRRTAAGIEIIERRSLPGLSIVAAAPVAVVLGLPAIASSRTAARRVQSANQLRQIALALLNYEQANRKFPPAYTSDKNGKPLLSWRVQILPYLEQNDLYQQFHLDEPWDSPHNKALIARMPATFKSPGSKLSGGGKTNFLTVRGESTIFPGKREIGFADIRDGSSNTIMTVEVSDEKAVEWTKPDDFTYDEKDPSKGLVGLWPGGFYAGFADGSVRFLRANIGRDALDALFTRDGGEVIDPNALGQ